jgi:hypothetical protein
MHTFQLAAALQFEMEEVFHMTTEHAYIYTNIHTYTITHMHAFQLAAALQFEMEEVFHMTTEHAYIYTYIHTYTITHMHAFQLAAALQFEMEEVFHMTTEGIKGRMLMLRHAQVLYVCMSIRVHIYIHVWKPERTLMRRLVFVCMYV